MRSKRALVVIAAPVIVLMTIAVVPAQEGRGAGRGQAPGERGLGPPRPAPPRDDAAALPLTTGTAAVAGTVIVTGTGSPARRARVTLNATEGGGSRSTTTDDEGRYSFQGLSAGRYSLSANKSGHVGVSYGATRPGRPGTPIQLADGEQFAANLQLPRGGVITGTVVDEHGEPAPGTQVRAMRYAMQAGRRSLQQAGSGSTDDRGIYRIYGLLPGDYVVSASARNPGPGMEIGRLQAELESVRQRLGAIAPGDAAARELAMRASLLQADLPRQDEQLTGYAPVFYPGTVAPSQAAAVPVGVGEERTSVDFQLQRVPLSRVDGIVVNSTGQPARNVQITLADGAHSAPGAGVYGARADAEGRFRIANVPPGNYRLTARANGGPRPGEPAADPAAARGRGPQPTPIRLWGTVDLSVDGRNVSNVVVSLQAGLSVSGTIVFEGSAPPPPDLTRLRVTLAPADAGAPGLVQSAAGTVDGTGRFVIPSVLPGLYRLTASGAGAAWSLASSVIDGRDTLDFPVEIKPGAAVGGAVVTFSDRQAQLSGAILTQRGQPALEQTLILYPADERYWAPQSRRIRSTRPATDGRFTFGGVPPGEYKLVALVDVEPGAWFDASFLQQIDVASMRITLREGEKKVQNLQISGG